MPENDWIEKEIVNFTERAVGLPEAVIDIIRDSLRGDLHKDQLTSRESERLAKTILKPMRQTEARDED